MSFITNVAAESFGGDTQYVRRALWWGENPLELLNMLLAYSLVIAALLSVVYIFIGGVSFILSGGQEDKIKKSVNTIRYSIIGLIITILSFTVISLVGKAMMGLDLIKYISFERIWDMINNISGDSSIDSGGGMEGDSLE